MTHRSLTARLLIVATAALVARTLPAAAALQLGRDQGALAITHVAVVDVGTGRILPDRTVTISGQTIIAVSRGGPPAGATVVDGRHKFLIPGLWDMHAHLEATGESSLQLYVANGVTGIRDMGSALDLILTLREATASGRVLGPRIFAAGPILDDAPGDWPFRMRVKTAEEGRAAVQLLKQRGVDLVKVHDHTPREAYFAIADEARRQGLAIAGHLPAGVTIEELIDAGQRDIEHLDNLQLWKACSGERYRAGACRARFKQLAHHGVWQTPTLVAMSELVSIGTPASLLSPDRLAYASQSLRRMWAANQGLFATPEAVKAMRAGAATGAKVATDMALAGVGLLAGCDTMIAGFCVHDELVAMVRGGMTPLAALRTATLNPARYFGLEHTQGTVAPGQRADLVLLDGNPLADIGNVRRISAVIAAGRFFDRAELDDVLSQVKVAAGEN